MRQAFTATLAALLLVLFGAAGPGFSEPAPQERKPAIVLAPPPGEAVKPEAPPAVEAEVPNRISPPMARKKPTPPKRTSAPRRAPEKPAAKAPAKQAPARKAPARAAAAPAPQAKDCDYCYGCESLSLHCKRQWVCGTKYTQRLAAGLCRR